MNTPSVRAAADLDVHARLKAAVEVPTKAHLWIPADEIEFTPRVLSKIYGDGRALFKITTINNRPAYWIIRGDSGWSCCDSRATDNAPEFGDFTDDILDEMEAQFGSSRCGYSGADLTYPPEERGCDCEECEDPYIAAFPEVDGDGGCSWGRYRWPDEFPTVEHPFAWGSILAADLADGAPTHAEGGEDRCLTLSSA